LKSAGEKVDVYLNVQKTKILSTATLNSFDLDDVEREVVGRFTLLGSLSDNQVHCASEIKNMFCFRKDGNGETRKGMERYGYFTENKEL